MDLEELRAKIDAVDDRLTAAYLERLELVTQVAEYKRAHAVEVEHTGREEAIFRRLAQKFGAEHRDAINYLYANIINYSKVCQREQLETQSEFSRRLSGGRPVPEGGFSDEKVACQGLPGAYSELAARQMIPGARPIFLTSWEDVFRAVSRGEAPFGVLPVENSTAGSVNEVYDLLVRYRLNVCGGRRIHIRHCLVGLPGSEISSLTNVVSHPQALYQCRSFIQAHGLEERKATNTAVAAESVAKGADPTCAAIASEETAKLYGLEILARGIQDAQLNDTRFLLVSAEPYLDAQANKVSLVVSIPHRKGTLFQLLGIVSAYGVNVVKLESRPIPGKNFEFLFYLDLDGNIRDDNMRRLVENIHAYCTDTVFLGSYRETEE